MLPLGELAKGDTRYLYSVFELHVSNSKKFFFSIVESNTIKATFILLINLRSVGVDCLCSACLGLSGWKAGGLKSSSLACLPVDAGC